MPSYTANPEPSSEDSTMQERTESTAPAKPPYEAGTGQEPKRTRDRRPQREREEKRREFEAKSAHLPDRALLVPSEAADYTGFPESTLRNSRLASGPQSGRLGGIKAPEHVTDGRRIYYRLGTLREWRKKYEARFEPRITTADA
jgi:hypothetical protein